MNEATIDLILLNKNKFDKTFLYEYCSYMKPHINRARFSMPPYIIDPKIRINYAAKVAANFIRSKKFKIPPPNALVIHLRLGDCYSTEPSIITWAQKLIPNKQQILFKINQYNGKKIIIVTAFNNHINNKNEIESSNNKSIQFLTDLKNSIPEKYDVSIQSSTNIDADFIYLCSAKNLLLTSPSLFGSLAQTISKILHKIAH
jgi:hypothetical protein